MLSYPHNMSQVRRGDASEYPDAHMAFSKKVVYEEVDEVEGSRRNRHHLLPGGHGHHHHNPDQIRERVEVVEYEQVPEVGVVREVTYEDSVDVESNNGYYPARRNRDGFESHQWRTYRP